MVAGLFLSLFFLPLAVIRSGEMFYSFQVAGLYSTVAVEELIFPTWSLMVLAAIIVLLSFVIIFNFKKRILQIRMCVFSTLLIIGFCALFGFYIWKFGKSPELPDLKVHLRLWAAFPIVSLILNYLAIRNIGADETMVRSLERLR